MATFTVTRSKWFRGQGGSPSKLLRPDGTRCCIGFVGQQCGIEDEDMEDVPDVLSMGNHVDPVLGWPKWFDEGASPDLNRAYEINDEIFPHGVEISSTEEDRVKDSDREAMLAEIFERNGDTLLFVD